MKEWKLHQHLDWKLQHVAVEIESQVQGWYNYYNKFGKTEFIEVMNHLNMVLAYWATADKQTLSMFARTKGSHNSYGDGGPKGQKVQTLSSQADCQSLYLVARDSEERQTLVLSLA